MSDFTKTCETCGSIRVYSTACYICKPPPKKIVALVGHAGSGKDTVAQMMPAQRIAFADTLKHICKQVFDFSVDQLWGPSEHRNAPDARYTREDGQPLTPRFALQTLGTEWGRRCHPDIWAIAGIRQASIVCDYEGKNVVITDCRFVNEARIVKQYGGEVWRVVRPGVRLTGEAAAHPSEVEQDSREMDALVDAAIFNDGSLDDLRREVERLCEARGVR